MRLPPLQPRACIVCGLKGLGLVGPLTAGTAIADGSVHRDIEAGVLRLGGWFT
jgi:hypothetical protein